MPSEKTQQILRGSASSLKNNAKTMIVDHLANNLRYHEDV